MKPITPASALLGGNLQRQAVRLALRPRVVADVAAVVAVVAGKHPGAHAGDRIIAEHRHRDQVLGQAALDRARVGILRLGGEQRQRDDGADHHRGGRDANAEDRHDQTRADDAGAGGQHAAARAGREDPAEHDKHAEDAEQLALGAARDQVHAERHQRGHHEREEVGVADGPGRPRCDRYELDVGRLEREQRRRVHEDREDRAHAQEDADAGKRYRGVVDVLDAANDQRRDEQEDDVLQLRHR